MEVELITIYVVPTLPIAITPVLALTDTIAVLLLEKLVTPFPELENDIV